MKYQIIITLILAVSSLSFSHGNECELTTFRSRDTHTMLARLINSEGAGEILSGQIGIGNVAKNIAEYKQLPIHNIITDAKLFHGVLTVKYREIPSPKSYIAALIVLYENGGFAKNVLYYYNPRTATNTKWVRKIQKYKYAQIGNHIFCYDPAYILV